MFIYCNCGKKCYTKKEAQTHLNSFKRTYNVWSHHGTKTHDRNRWYKRPLRIYQCPYCNYWHITSQTKIKGEKQNVRHFKGPDN